METDGAALMSYGRQFHIVGAAQRKARDPLFVWDEHGSSCLSSAEDLSARLKILLVIRDLTRFQEFVRQSDDLIVYAPLDKKPMKLLHSLGDADAYPLICDNTSERALQTLKPRNVLRSSSGSSWRNRGDSQRENRHLFLEQSSSLVWSWDGYGRVLGCDRNRILKVQSCVHQMIVYCRG